MSHWRATSEDVLLSLGIDRDTDPEEARRLVYDAYPFGIRKHHPYRIWNDTKRALFPWLFKAKQRPLPDWLKPKEGA
jgi:hypothetical protein